MMRLQSPVSAARLLLHLSAAIVVLLQLSCDPGWHLAGSVHSNAGVPIGGASIRTVCPDNRPPLPEATAMRDGRFDASSLGLFGSECSIEVQAAGFEARRYPVEPNCKHAGGFFWGGCLEVVLDAVLEPATADTCQ